MTGANSILLKAAPFLFILTWASGFPITRFGLEFTEPFTLLWIRSAIVVIFVGLYALIVQVPWPKAKEIAHIAVVGITLQCLYLGAMFSALSEGISQGVAALVAGMQPLLVTWGFRPEKELRTTTSPLMSSATALRRFLLAPHRGS